MNLLEVKNISKTYGNGETAVKALKDVSFSVPKGEYVAIVGNPALVKYTAEYDRCFGHANIWQGSD